jgi:ADP-ribose pyrophosphatase
VSGAHPHKPFPILIGTRTVYQGRVIEVRVDDIEVKDGLNVRRDIVKHPGAVVMLAIDSEGRILWVRQHRWAVRRELLELPAGTLERNEAPEACARRELAEETGFAAATWQALGGFYSAPGFCDEYLHAYAATGLTPEQAAGDEDEDITLVPLTLDETMARLEAGEIEDAKSLATLMLYLRKRGR